MWVNNWTFDQATVPAEVSWSQDRNLERPLTGFNVYGGKLSHVSAQHIGFVIYYKQISKSLKPVFFAIIAHTVTK